MLSASFSLVFSTTLSLSRSIQLGQAFAAIARRPIPLTVVRCSVFKLESIH
ncbi:unnamed protein product [Rhodiola kirilowii]